MYGTVRHMGYMDEPCYVYCLVDPWKRGNPPFYIGISNNPWYRFYSHCHDRCSAAYDALQILLMMKEPRDRILKIYKKCPNRRAAIELEHRLVTSTPKLLNRPYVRGRSYA
jgi:predicted GIY-YIG superfamily endonuclease